MFIYRGDLQIQKNSDQPESNQRPKDNRATLQSSALPAELWSASIFLSEDSLNSQEKLIKLETRMRKKSFLYPIYSYYTKLAYIFDELMIIKDIVLSLNKFFSF